MIDENASEGELPHWDLLAALDGTAGVLEAERGHLGRCERLALGQLGHGECVVGEIGTVGLGRVLQHLAPAVGRLDVNEQLEGAGSLVVGREEAERVRAATQTQRTS